MQRAIFGTRSGEVLVGHGPFASSHAPPSSGVAFYINDFALSDPEPWKIPAEWECVSSSECEPKPISISWDELLPEHFTSIFREVTEAIARGVIEKSVPVVVAQGQITQGSPQSLEAHLHKVPETLRPYGFFDDEGGYLGATPEGLFSLKDGVLKTMALAGTARAEESQIFAVDDKEIREHEFVAQTLIAKLSDLGMVRRHDREILELRRIVHFQTLIEVELYRQEEIDFLVSRLHPTPALGPLPRNDETLSRLYHWRDQLGCPAHFGAPFGLWRESEFEALVGIRMLSWRGNQVRLPSGCGVIQESRLVNEWRELRLKRESVLELFQI